jgi:hypothetical protein
MTCLRALIPARENNLPGLTCLQRYEMQASLSGLAYWSKHDLDTHFVISTGLPLPDQEF